MPGCSGEGGSGAGVSRPRDYFESGIDCFCKWPTCYHSPSNPLTEPREAIMSHRTQHLPPLPGLPGRIRELRYHEASRQGLALILIVVLGLAGDPRWAPLYWLGVSLVVLGEGVRLWASGHIVKNKELTTTGPYALVRHPLYVGNILLLAGFAAASGLWWSAPVVLALLLFYYPPAVEYEDHRLSRLFESQWREWAGHTRALIPNRRWRDAMRGDWSWRQSLIANGEPLIALFEAIWLLNLYRLLGS